METLNTIRNGLGDAIKLASRALLTPKLVLRDDIGEMTDSDMIGHYRSTRKLLIWTGGSDATIFGNAEVNWLFRGWHDYCHILSGVCNREHGVRGCFEPIAEYAVADFQCIGLGDKLANVVQIEVASQAKHFETTGKFVDNQLDFYADMIGR